MGSHERQQWEAVMETVWTVSRVGRDGRGGSHDHTHDQVWAAMRDSNGTLVGSHGEAVAA